MRRINHYGLLAGLLMMLPPWLSLLSLSTLALCLLIETQNRENYRRDGQEKVAVDAAEERDYVPLRQRAIVRVVRPAEDVGGEV